MSRTNGRRLKPTSANGKRPTNDRAHKPFHRTLYGAMMLGDALEVLGAEITDASVDLVVTSPPFGLVRKKEYGNEDASGYVEWFKPFGEQFHRILKDSGSLVIDIGGSWIRGQPTRSLYHYELLLMLCNELGFHLAQEFFWWNPSKLPTPAEWVNVRRVRVKDAVNCIWWLSKTPWPKASNRRVLTPYSDSMKDLLKNGYKAKLRPSGHDISNKFSWDNGAAIPPNLIAVANTESNSQYLRLCREAQITPHPARYPADIPEFFLRMLTDEGDSVVDPFAGSCVTGEVAERLGRTWVCIDNVEEYLKGALFRFSSGADQSVDPNRGKVRYRLAHPAAYWAESDNARLPGDGGRKRPTLKKRGQESRG